MHEQSLLIFNPEEATEAVPVPSLEGALGGKVHETKQEGVEEEVLGAILGGASEVQPEMEKVGEGPPVTPVAAKVGPSLGTSYATPAFAAPGSI